MAHICTALETGTPILDTTWWSNATDDELAHVFRRSPSSREDIPLLDTRIRLMREAADVLQKKVSEPMQTHVFPS